MFQPAVSSGKSASKAKKEVKQPLEESPDTNTKRKRSLGKEKVCFHNFTYYNCCSYKGMWEKIMFYQLPLATVTVHGCSFLISSCWRYFSLKHLSVPFCGAYVSLFYPLSVLVSCALYEFFS